MRPPVPSVSRFMTTLPLTVGAEQSVATAARLLREHDIRHLPVLAASRLVGLLSERDVALVEALDGVDPQLIRVEDAMTPAPWTTGPDTPLDEVARTMAERKLGAAVIVRHDKVVGIFTTIDVCRALHALWHAAPG